MSIRKKGLILFLISAALLAGPEVIEIPSDVAATFRNHNRLDVNTYIRRNVHPFEADRLDTIKTIFPDDFTAIYVLLQPNMSVAWHFVPGSGRDPDGTAVECGRCVGPPYPGAGPHGGGAGDAGQSGSSQGRGSTITRTRIITYSDCHFDDQGDYVCSPVRQIIRY